jgi:SpoVK/Ycf46/Vps4 family AAA+-type ATPase
MNLKPYLHFFVAILISLTPHSISALGADLNLDGMVGTLPAKLCWIMEQLKENKDLPKKVLLLHGKPGNGKTTLARKIAEYIDGEYISIAGPGIVGSYVGQGAQNIADAFNAAATRVVESMGKTVIIFIDEIDAIASNIKTEFRAEHKVALQRLWLAIDEHKGDRKIFVIFATNHLEKLDKTFLDRFGGNVFEIKNPDYAMRRKVIEYYFAKQNLVIEEPTLDKLAKKTDGLSVRAIEDLINDVYVVSQLNNKGMITNGMIFDALKQTKSKFENNASDEEEREKKWQKASLIVSVVGGILSATLNTYYLGNIIGSYLIGKEPADDAIKRPLKIMNSAV